MANPSPDCRRWVKTTVESLRQIQIDGAGDERRDRHRRLEETLKVRLEALAGGDRETYCKELLRLYPQLGKLIDSVSSDAGRGDPPDAAPGPTPDARPKTVAAPAERGDLDALVVKLIDAWPGLCADERLIVRDRLASAGIVTSGASSAWPEEFAEDLRARLGIEDGPCLQPDRALLIIDLLVCWICDLNKVAVQTWREIATDETFSDPANLRSEMAKCLCGDRNVSREQVASCLERPRRLIASMIWAIRVAPREWAHEHLEKVSVQAIESIIDVEGNRFTKGREIRCWRKYKQLASKLDKHILAHEILETVAECAIGMLERAAERSIEDRKPSGGN